MADVKAFAIGLRPSCGTRVVREKKAEADFWSASVRLPLAY